MSPNRSFKLVVPLGLALLAGCFAASLASAQGAYSGKFTLPFEARWGKVVLPPGEYSFTLDSAWLGGKATIQTETGRVLGMIPNLGIYDQQTIGRTELVLARSGGSYRIRALRLADLDITLEYPVPKAERQLISQAPQLLQRIPIIMGGQ